MPNMAAMAQGMIQVLGAAGMTLLSLILIAGMVASACGYPPNPQSMVAVGYVNSLLWIVFAVIWIGSDNWIGRVK